MSARARILVVHPDLRPPGGGNAVAAWSIQALVPRFDVDVLGFVAAPLQDLNRFYGTELAEGDFRWVLPPRRARVAWSALSRCPTPLDVLKRQILGRSAKQLCRSYDLVFATENEMDLGGRGLQYVHYPWLVRRRPHGLRGCLLWPGAPLDLYYRLSFAISGYDEHAMRRNLTVVNSDWTARRVIEVHGIQPRTLYPPVAGDPQRYGLPWSQRENGFVMVGRFATEKRIDRVIDVLTRVRAHGHDVHLHLVGSRTSCRTALAVLRHAGTRPWVSIHEDLPRTAMLALLGRQRYGIHAMPDEHFGIAVAEMVASGCIPFVPAGGGQVEIVAQPELTYHNDDEAVERIVAVLRDTSRQEALRHALDSHAHRFGADRFVSELGAIVDDLLLKGAAHSSTDR